MIIIQTSIKHHTKPHEHYANKLSNIKNHMNIIQQAIKHHTKNHMHIIREAIKQHKQAIWTSCKQALKHHIKPYEHHTQIYQTSYTTT